MTRLSMAALVLRMQSANNRDDADHLRAALERTYLPNQVLREGAGDLARLVLGGLRDASEYGMIESWELLGQLAAGASSAPTAAETAVIDDVRAALPRAAELATERLSDSGSEGYDYLAVDVLDAMLSFADEHAQVAYLTALKKFAQRGIRESQAVGVIFKDE